MVDLPDLHREHREDHRRFSIEQAEPWHRAHLDRLYQAWDEYNAAYFENAMISPYIQLLEPITPKTYGDTSAVSGFGGRMQIRIRPSLARGDHPHMKHGSQDAEGIERFVLDILLHEMIHQYQHEVLGVGDDSYDGHGPAFLDSANRIGAALGLPPVRVSKVRAAQRGVPSCAQWPHCVRPPEYYCGAIWRKPKAERLPEDELLAQIEQVTKDVDAQTLGRLCDRLLARKNHTARRGTTAITDRQRASIGPRGLKPTGSVDWCWQVLGDLKTKWEHHVITQEWFDRVMTEVVEARVWEVVPPEHPYGSLEAMLLAELGEAFTLEDATPIERVYRRLLPSEKHNDGEV